MRRIIIIVLSITPIAFLFAVNVMKERNNKRYVKVHLEQIINNCL